MEPLILLHGAIGAKDQFQPLADQLQYSYQLHLLNFMGHGGTEMLQEFTIAAFAEQVLQYMRDHSIDKANLFGYSMGGYVAMYIAKKFPDKINKCITLATKYYWDEEVAANETKKLNPEVIKSKVPAFAQQLKERHTPQDWELLLQKTSALLTGLGKNNVLNDYADINIPVLLLIGDRDKMITLEETVNVYKQLPNAQMGMIPLTSHPIEQVNIEYLLFLVRKFLDASPGYTRN